MATKWVWEAGRSRLSAEMRSRFVLFLAGSLSVGSLLLYFFGVASFRTLATVCLSVELLAIAACWFRGGPDAKRRLAGGLWAGCVATLAYDVVRVPLVHAGLPVFKAISYFGTVLAGEPAPSLASEAAGWAYHLSNGVSFGLMYAAIIPSPGLVSAVAWGLVLEAVMLLTPYAEVFGYQRDAKFMAITIGAHAVYGLGLWWGLRRWNSGPVSRPLVWSALAVTSLGLGGIAADFHGRFGARLSQSPPPRLGPHLYVTWNTPEPDRITATWMLLRFVDPEAKFHFVEPFDHFRFGKQFDTPEAEIRRTGSKSAARVFADLYGLRSPGIDFLTGASDLAEVSPWMLPSRPDAQEWISHLRQAAEKRCGAKLSSECVADLWRLLDERNSGPNAGSVR